MRFGPVSLDSAQGKILGHNVTGADGRRVLRKGKPLSTADITLLEKLGRDSVYVATFDEGDVDENAAAKTVTQAAMGSGLRMSGPSTGRANIYADSLGLFRVDPDRLARLNSCAGITLATLPTHTAVRPGKMVATLKIIPYGLPKTSVDLAAALSAEKQPLLRIDTLSPARVGLILSGANAAKERIVNSFTTALNKRLERLAASLTTIDFVPLDDESDERQFANKLAEQLAAQHDLIIVAGDTAIQDRWDLAPRAVERAGAEIIAFGAPVDPGNLLMLAYHGLTPIVGAPGCSRSPKSNIIDLVLPRLLAGDRLMQADIIAFGHGGLLEDVPERPLPRAKIQ